MHNFICGTCVHYRQHYTFVQCKIYRVYCGHCTYQKVKRKRPDAKACDNYSHIESAGNTFATKEYLSKALLDYILGLDLLPEICDLAKE